MLDSSMNLFLTGGESKICPCQSPCITYDYNEDGQINLGEAVSAVTDYFDLKINLETVISVIVCYFGSNEEQYSNI